MIKASNTTYLAIDPGTVQFAYCVVKNNKVVKATMLLNPIHKMTDNDLLFIKEINEILDIYKPKEVIIERFLIRRFLTPTVETVSYMIGIIRIICLNKKIEFKKITASTWKNALKKHFDLKEFYINNWKLYKLPPHPIDAMIINKFNINGLKFESRDVKWIKDNIPKCVKTFTKVKKCKVVSKSKVKIKKKT